MSHYNNTVIRSQCKRKRLRGLLVQKLLRISRQQEQEIEPSVGPTKNTIVGDYTECTPRKPALVSCLCFTEAVRDHFQRELSASMGVQQGQRKDAKGQTILAQGLWIRMRPAHQSTSLLGLCLGQFWPDFELLVAGQEMQEESFAYRGAMRKPSNAGMGGVACCCMSAFCSE